MAEHNWREWARTALPLGTRRRDAARGVRRIGDAVQEGLVAAGGVLEGDHRQALLRPRKWLQHHHGVHETDQARVRLVEGARGDVGLPVALLLDARGAPDSAVVATESSLREGWSTQWSLQVAATDAALSSSLEDLAASEPTQVVMVLAAGDSLRPDLLARVLDAFWEEPGLRLVHWDETAAASGEGIRVRPDWSPDLLLSANAWGRAFALRAVDWDGFRPELGDAAWWEVLLRAGLAQDDTRRLARVGMVSARPHETVPIAGTEVVGEELVRRGWPARPSAVPEAVWLTWDPSEMPTVSIVVPSRHNRPLLERLLPSLVATDYPDLEVVVVDNSGRSEDKEAWYRHWEDRLELQVQWWDESFNYSAVNNFGASFARGEVLVFLNDDTEATSPGWLQQMVGWVTRPEIGTVGAQLIDPDGLIQHGGVVLGMDGSAGHLFAGMPPRSDSLLGRTEWTRNVLASTAACVALRREVFDAVGGFDERFVLCGSDVVLGLQAHVRGLRNVVVPAVGMSHMESATLGPRGGVPEDLFASWWHYQRWLVGGDPFFSPSLSLRTHRPQLRPPGEPRADRVMLESMGRPSTVFRQEMLEATAAGMALAYPVGDDVVEAVRTSHALAGGHDVRTVNWVVPGFDNPHYGGLATIIRIAELLARQQGVEQRFVILDAPQESFYRSALAAGSAWLSDCRIIFLGGDGLEEIDRIPPADAVIATMWTTAYVAATAPAQRRRFYLVQDFEPCFYPAGTLYALAEETYRLGLYGICNTEPIHAMYTGRYDGEASWFLPAVDRGMFFPPTSPRWVDRSADEPVRIFVYSRPGHWRNCWEIARPALEAVKEEFGERVHIVTAGSWASPDDLGTGIQHLGLLDVRSTAELYRRCDVGMALTVSEHPSYLPGELMACGVPVVAFDLPEADWILQHERTGLRARQTVEGLRAQLARLIEEPELRRRCGEGALEHIGANHSDWDAALSGIWDYLCDPGDDRQA